MTTYNHDSIVPFKGSEDGKKQQIASMFDRIAFRYDFLNRFLSGGIDIYWRRRTIRELTRGGAPKSAGASGSSSGPAANSGAPGFHPSTILDVATGTADMALMMNKYLSPQSIKGIDISNGMLEVGRQKIAKAGLQEKIQLQTGDSEAIQFADNSFDAVTVAFGVRNFEHLERGLQEMLRVLKPGGRLAILEFSQPRTPVIRQLYAVYLRLVAPGLGKMFSKSREAYQYLNDSVQAFPEGKALVDVMDKQGYTQTRFKRLSLGICTVYVAEKAV